MPLGALFKSKVIERMESRLESWKALLLSKGDRLTLIQAVLAFIPNYFLSLFTIPVLVTTTLLWNDILENHNYHFVNWNPVCRSKTLSGLGIKKIRFHNIALLAKWVW